MLQSLPKITKLRKPSAGCTVERLTNRQSKFPPTTEARVRELLAAVSIEKQQSLK
jgi:hypothetical protein